LTKIEPLSAGNPSKEGDALPSSENCSPIPTSSTGSDVSPVDDNTLESPSKKRKSRPAAEMTFRDAAYYVLQRSHRLMSAAEIIAEGLDLGIISTEGKTPANTMSSRLNQDIAKNRDSDFVKFGAGKFSIRPKFVEHIKQDVLTSQEQEWGMTLLKFSALKYIPHELELNWLEVKPSKIPNSGRGLYAKRRITAGTVLCEYKGRFIQLDGTGGDHKFYPYVISVQLNNTAATIDGADESGTVLSLGPIANDAGPCFQKRSIGRIY